jgi:hypothetical protein
LPRGETRDVAERGLPSNGCEVRSVNVGEATAATADAWIAAWDAKAAQDSLERGSASLSSRP